MRFLDSKVVTGIHKGWQVGRTDCKGAANARFKDWIAEGIVYFRRCWGLHRPLRCCYCSCCHCTVASALTWIKNWVAVLHVHFFTLGLQGPCRCEGSLPPHGRQAVCPWSRSCPFWRWGALCICALTSWSSSCVPLIPPLFFLALRCVVFTTPSQVELFCHNSFTSRAILTQRLCILGICPCHPHLLQVDDMPLWCVPLWSCSERDACVCESLCIHACT